MLSKLFGFKKEINKEPLYYCLGVKPRTDEFRIEDLESCFNFVNRVKDKVFTKKEIELISQKLGFDVEQYYTFIDQTYLKADQTKEKEITEFRVQYLWNGVKEKLVPGDKMNDVMKDILSKKGFLDRSEIETISQEIGCSVWDRNKWESFLIIDFVYNDAQNYSILRDPKASEELKKKMGK